jgi:hypothetical protein
VTIILIITIFIILELSNITGPGFKENDAFWSEIMK